MTPEHIDLNELTKDLEKEINFLNEFLKSSIPGLPSPKLISDIEVNVYGGTMRLKELAQINSGQNVLEICFYDKNVVKDAESALWATKLGTVQQKDKSLVLVFPPVTRESINNLCKKAHETAESAKMGIRNVRRKFLNQIEHYKKTNEDFYDSESVKIEKEIDKISKKLREIMDKFDEKWKK